jgi:hypothetical protein
LPETAIIVTGGIIIVDITITDILIITGAIIITAGFWDWWRRG